MVLVLFLISIFLLTVTITHRLERNMAEQIETQQFNNASYIADSIDNQVKLRYAALTAMAAIINNDTISSPSRLSEILRTRTTLQTLFGNGVMVLSKDGRGIVDYPVIPGRASLSYAEREYFKDVVATGKPAVGKPFRGSITKTPLMALAVPIVDKKGTLIGVLAGYVPLSDPALLGTIEKTVYMGFPDSLTLVSPRYKMVATGTDPTRIMTPTPETGINTIFDRFMAGFDGSGIIVNSRGIQVILSAKHIPTLGWFVRLALPTDIAFAPIHRMKISVYTTAVGLSILSSIVVWIIITFSFRPLYSASMLIKDITENRLPLQHIPVTQQDEIGQLFNSFNQLVNHRKQAEEELLYFQMAVSNATDAIGMSTPEGRHYYQNEAFSKLFGLSVEDINGQSGPPSTVYADEQVGRHVFKTIMGGGTFTGEIKMFDKNKKIKDIFLRAYAIKNKENTVVGLVGVHTDITEKKRAESELRENESRSRALLSAIPDMMFRMNRQGILLDYKASKYEFFANSELSLIGMQSQDLSSPEFAALIEQKITKALQSNEMQTFEYQLPQRGGGLRDYEARMVVSGKDEVITIVRDVTEQKRIEHERIERKSQEQAMNLVLMDIHDSIGGVITNIIILAESALRLSSPEDIKKTVATISDLARDKMVEIRNIMSGLDVEGINWHTIGIELKNQGMKLLERHHISYDLKTDFAAGSPEPTRQLLLQMFRIYHEALTNVIKHAMATRVIVDFCVGHDKVVLSVKDNGRGFVESALHEGGRGLSNIINRAKSLQGTATIRGDHGTQLTVEIPFPAQSSKSAINEPEKKRREAGNA